MVFAVIVVALALAQGLQSATVQTRDLPSNIITFPINVDGQQVQIQTLPGFILPEFRPLPLPVPEEETPVLRPHPIPEVPVLRPLPEAVVPEVPVLRPLPEIIVPEVEAVVPELIIVNPCDSCFEYMSALIEQLTGVPELVPHPMPEVEVLPEAEAQPEFSILPHPMPQVEVVSELRPLPREYLRN